VRKREFVAVLFLEREVRKKNELKTKEYAYIFPLLNRFGWTNQSLNRFNSFELICLLDCYILDLTVVAPSRCFVLLCTPFQFHVYVFFYRQIWIQWFLSISF